MSKDANNTDAAKGKYQVVRNIMSLMKLGDAGKLDWVYDKIVSKWNKDLKSLKFELQRLEMEHKSAVADFKERISEADGDIAAVISSVDADEAAKLRSTDVAGFIKGFEKRLEEAEIFADELSEELDELVEAYDETVEIINDQVSALQARIKVIG